MRHIERSASPDLKPRRNARHDRLLGRADGGHGSRTVVVILEIDAADESASDSAVWLSPLDVNSGRGKALEKVRTEQFVHFGVDPLRLPFPLSEVNFGKQTLQVLYTPGHCDGSISLYDAANGYVICGDLLFEGSVGRSDLPTGNGRLLIEMIKTKILTLPDETNIYPGHGGLTTVGNEKLYNPYLV